MSEKTLDIIPAQTLRAKIIAVQHIEKGEAVGYGSKWIAPRPSRIGHRRLRLRGWLPEIRSERHPGLG